MLLSAVACVTLNLAETAGTIMPSDRGVHHEKHSVILRNAGCVNAGRLHADRLDRTLPLNQE
jgi:hypothetical protein